MKSPLTSPSLIALWSCLCAAAFFAACSTTVQNSLLLNPATNSAIRSEPRDGNWLKRHEGFVALAQEGGIDVLFLGDSITDSWRNRGQAVWVTNYGKMRAANFGISGDRTQHVLWRMQNGELDGVQPKVVVLMIGTNNTGFERDKVTPRNTVPEATEGVKAVVRGLRAKLPAAKILLLAIFPRGEKPDDPQRLQVAEINRGLARLADSKTVRFLDIGPKFLTADGALTREIMPDFLHPSEKGYEIWADAIRGPLAEMMQ